MYYLFQEDEEVFIGVRITEILPLLRKIPIAYVFECKLNRWVLCQNYKDPRFVTVHEDQVPKEYRVQLLLLL